MLPVSTLPLSPENGDDTTCTASRLATTRVVTPTIIAA